MLFCGLLQVCSNIKIKTSVPAKHLQMFLRADFLPEGKVFRSFKKASKKKKTTFETP